MAQVPYFEASQLLQGIGSCGNACHDTRAPWGVDIGHQFVMIIMTF